MTPAEVRFALDRTLLAMAQGDVVPRITGLHSTSIEGTTVFVNYDLAYTADQAEDLLLFFEFDLPALVNPDDVREFALWLALSGRDEVMH